MNKKVYYCKSLKFWCCLLHSKADCYTKSGTRNKCCPNKIPQTISLEMCSRSVMESFWSVEKMSINISGGKDLVHLRYRELRQTMY